MARPLIWLLAGVLPCIAACIGLGEPEGTTPGRLGTLDAGSLAARDAGPRSEPDAGAPERDAGALDSGHGNAGGADAGASVPDAGANPSLCAAANFALCSGFDAPALESPWHLDPTNDAAALVETDTKHVLRGARSLHVRIPYRADDSSVNAGVVETATFPALQDVMYGRVFVYFETNPPPHNMSMVTGHQYTPHQGTYGENIDVTRFYAVQWNQSPHIDEGFNSATTLSLNRWMCLEWRYSGSQGTTQTWVDGKALTDISETGWVPVNFQELDLGLGEPHGALVAPQGYDAWYDELALDGARIGCDR